jgi:hypothetical protein
MLPALVIFSGFGVVSRCMCVVLCCVFMVFCCLLGHGAVL